MAKKNEEAEEKPRTKKVKVITTITKIKLKKSVYLVLGYNRVESDGAITKHLGEEYDRVVHPDLQAKLQEGAIHYALLSDHLSTQQIKSLDKYNPELVKDFHLTGISIKPDEGVTLTGYKLKKNGQAVNGNTPFTYFEAEDDKAYRYAEELKQWLDEVTAEVLQYMDGSKKGDPEQVAMEFPEPEMEEAE